MSPFASIAELAKLGLSAEALAKAGPFLIDGAMGTMLMAAGLEAGTPPEAWTLARPDDVSGVHRLYAEAGADIVETNTFGANRLRLAQAGRADDMERLNLEAVRLARAAAGPDCLVAGCIGPSGSFLPPVGALSEGELRDSFAAQAETLARAGVDLLIIETMMDLREAVQALHGARSVANLAAAVTLTFNRTPRGFFSLMGDTVEATAKTLADHGAAAVGANCTLTSGDMIALAREFLTVSPLPVIMQPNAGQPEIRNGALAYPGDPGAFACDLERMAAEGVRLVGGCCGTTPEYTRRTAERLRETAVTHPPRSGNAGSDSDGTP